MRIKKDLVQAASFNPTKNTRQISVFEMCNKIEFNAMSLPLYQRDLSWTLQKCIDLFDYQLLGKAPVSPISVNVINEVEKKVPQVSFIEREIIDNIERGQQSIVDGQQRVTTNYKAYINHSDYRNVVLDLTRGCFVKSEMSIKNNQIPVGILLNKDDTVLSDYTKKIKSLQNHDVMTLLFQIRSKMKNYNYTINSAEDLSEDEQIEWFEVLNNAGSRVSIIQMRFSKLKAHGIDIYKQYTSIFNNTLIESGYNFFIPEKTTVSYPISALNPAYEVITGRLHSSNYAPMSSDSKESQLCNLKPDDLTKCFAMTLDVLDYVLEFINENNLKAPDRIDYVNYLIGYFVFKGKIINGEQKERVIRWYDEVNFTNKSNSARREIFNKLLEI